MSTSSTGPVIDPKSTHVTEMPPIVVTTEGIPAKEHLEAPPAARIAVVTAAKWAAPPSARSSRATVERQPTRRSRSSRTWASPQRWRGKPPHRCRSRA